MAKTHVLYIPNKRFNRCLPPCFKSVILKMRKFQLVWVRDSQRSFFPVNNYATNTYATD